MKHYSTLFLFLIAAEITHADDPVNYDHVVLEAAKIQSKITIDGILEEDAWKSAQPTSEFINKWPKDTGFAENQTNAWVTFDDEYLYIAAINYQKKSDLVIKSLKRDNPQYHWYSDGFSVVLDPFNQKTSGFLFGVNAAGARVEGIVSIENSNTTMDINWDSIWLSAVKVYDDYWVAEFAIPFKSINYNPEAVEWGVNFIRNDMKRNEYSTWNRVPLGFDGIDLGHLGTLHLEEQPVERQQRIAVQPYLLNSTSVDFEENTGWQNSFDAGFDAKIPLSSSFNVDLTFNPDFSTVDVDQQVTNLTRFSIFFPEKRTFFLENSDLFGSFGTWGIKPFFSRQIGIHDGELVPILFGVRSTGNLSSGLRVGALNAQTRSTNELQANNYSVMAVQQPLFGRSNIKALITNRSAFDAMGSTKNDFNRTFGAEFNYTSNDGKVNGNLRYHWSQTEEHLGDASFAGATLMYNDGKYLTGITADRLGDNFINEMGFSQRSFHYDAVSDSLIRVGFSFLNPWVGFILRPKAEWINTIQFDAGSILSWQTDSTPIESVHTLNYRMQTRDLGFLLVSLENSTVRLLFPGDLIGGDEFLPAKRYRYNTASMRYFSDQRGVVSGSLHSSYGGFYNGTRFEFGGSLNLRAQPWGNFGVSYTGNRVKFPANYGKGTIHLVGPQAEISFSNNLNWTTFLQYNTQDDNFNINSRLQWRFAPMSDIFLVYNDNYGTENFTVKNRGVVLKMNYWFN